MQAAKTNNPDPLSTPGLYGRDLMCQRLQRRRWPVPGTSRVSVWLLALALGAVGDLYAQFTATADVNGSLPAGSIVTNAPGSFTMTGGGADVWDATDQFFFAYQEVSGDFDVRVRVTQLDPVNTWSKAGIMVRETLAPDSRMVFNRVTPAIGANDTRLAYRTGLPGAGSNGGQHEDGQGSPGYPNAWLRVLRSGDGILGYQSVDGTNWTLQGELDTAGWQGGGLSGTLLVGLGVTSHAQGIGAAAEFRDYVVSTCTRVAVGTHQLVVVEAEDADANASPVGASRWDRVIYGVGSGPYSGEGFMQSTPEAGRRVDSMDGLAESPRLDFCVNFPSGGTWYVWLRGIGADADANSVHIGLAGVSSQPLNWRIGDDVTGGGWGGNDWRWVNDANGGIDTPARITVPHPGSYTFNVWMGEDGVILDKVLLTADSGYDPRAINNGLGPRATSLNDGSPLRIVQQPADVYVKEGSTAQFSVEVSGGLPHLVQWFKNGEAISGATNQTYTTVATAADDGTVYHAVVSNFVSQVASAAATLFVTELPRVVKVLSSSDPRTVCLVFSEEVDPLTGLNPENYMVLTKTGQSLSIAEVHLAVDGQSVCLELIGSLGLGESYTAVVSGLKDLDGNSVDLQADRASGVRAVFQADFNNGELPENAMVSGDSGRIEDGVLKLTDAMPSTWGRFDLQDPANNTAVRNFEVIFDLNFFGSTCCDAGQRPADGMSFNIIQNPPAQSPVDSEEGVGGLEHFRVSFDTWDNGSSEAPAIDVWVDGELQARQAIQVSGSPVGASASDFKTVRMTLQPSGPSFHFDLTLDGTPIFENLDLPGYDPAKTVGANWVWAARTGGANDNHWLDNFLLKFAETVGPARVEIAPQEVAVQEGQRVTFSAEVGGTRPVVMQWTRNGVPIAGAHGHIYKTPPVNSGDDGSVYQLVVSNLFGSTVSSPAVLTVLPNPYVIAAWSFGDLTEVRVRFNKPVSIRPGSGMGFAISDGILVHDQAHGTDPNEVRLTTDLLAPFHLYTLTVADVTDQESNTILPNPITVEFRPATGSVLADFNDGLPADLATFGTAFVAGSGGLHESRALKLTLAAGSQLGSFLIDAPNGGLPVEQFTVSFKVLIGGGTLNSALGLSFNLANDLGNLGFDHMGAGTGLTIAFNDRYNENQLGPGIDVLWQRKLVGRESVIISQGPAGRDYVDVYIHLDPDGTLDLNYGGRPIFADFPTPYIPIAGAQFGFGASTRSDAWDNHWIDDLYISTLQSTGPPSLVVQPSSTSTPEGLRASFSVLAEGKPPYSYQWRKNGVEIPGATSWSYFTPPNPFEEDGSAYSVVVSNALGFVISSNALLTLTPPSQLTPFTGQTNVGGARPRGSVQVHGPGSYSVTGGGADIWDSADQFFFSYAEVTGDFDVRARVETLDAVNTWTKAGVMVRETLTPDSRMAFIRSTPAAVAVGAEGNPPGANDIRLGYRTGIPGLGSNGGQHEDGGGRPQYPNAWLRLARSGDSIVSHNSTNGIDWINRVELDTRSWQGGGWHRTCSWAWRWSARSRGVA